MRGTSPCRPTLQKFHAGFRKGKAFFFVDYQGQRTVEGIETGLVSVPSLLNHAGDFSDSARASVVVFIETPRCTVSGL
jgi:hypothetical protein